MNAATLVTGILALVLLGACGDDESPSPQFPDVTIQQRDFYFEPMNLTSLEFLSIRSGDTAKELTLEIKNAGSVAHTFTITEPAIDEELQPGDVRLARMPNGSRSYEFFCRFHRDRGMTGNLTIAGTATP